MRTGLSALAVVFVFLRVVSAQSALSAFNLAEPFVSSQQEQAVFEFMNRPCEFQWSDSTTVKEMHDDLSRHLPIVVDTLGLEDIGLDSNECFGDKNSSKADPLRSVDEPKVDNASSKWWRKDGGVSGKIRVTNGGRILFLLEQLDLTVNIQSGQLAITTVDRSQSSLVVGVYDVGHLVSARDAAASRQHTMTDSDLASLLQTTVAADSWERMGGYSTMSTLETAGRTKLVVAAPLVVHWKVRALLQKLKN